VGDVERSARRTTSSELCPGEAGTFMSIARCSNSQWVTADKVFEKPSMTEEQIRQYEINKRRGNEFKTFVVCDLMLTFS